MQKDWCVLAVGLCGVTSSVAGENGGPMETAADALVVRPACFVATVVGSAVFVVALQPDVQMLNSKPERLLAAAKRLKVDAEKLRRDLAAAEKAKAKKPAKGKK